MGTSLQDVLAANVLERRPHSLRPRNLRDQDSKGRVPVAWSGPCNCGALFFPAQNRVADLVSLRKCNGSHGSDRWRGLHFVFSKMLPSHPLSLIRNLQKVMPRLVQNPGWCVLDLRNLSGDLKSPLRRRPHPLDNSWQSLIH